MSDLKNIARAKVFAALKAGKLVRPAKCGDCRQPGPKATDGRATIHAHHHKGYERPLDVVWLCPACHFQKDKRASKEMNGRAKLDSETVALIRAKHKRIRGNQWTNPSSTSMRALAAEFGVARVTIHRIVRNKNWIDETLHGAGS